MSLLLTLILSVTVVPLYIGACWIVIELGRLALIGGIKVLRAIALRIVEFNKGAVAAPVLIATVILGIATQIMK
jgi:hypothetical protein